MKGIGIVFSAALLLGTAICSNVTAEPAGISGAYLKNICESYTEMPANTSDGMCIGYVVGVISVMKYINVLCLPDKSTHSQATLVVKKYLSDHPEKLHLNAEELVFAAILEAFPCTDTSMQ
jgi:hypothetical protein